VITDGLQPGERIVVEGLQKVKDGMTVNAKLISMETSTAQQAEPAKMPFAGHEQR